MLLRAGVINKVFMFFVSKYFQLSSDNTIIESPSIKLIMFDFKGLIFIPYFFSESELCVEIRYPIAVSFNCAALS